MINKKISTASQQERIGSFDFFRAYGCLAIVLLHVISAWRDDPTNSNSFYSVGYTGLIFDNAIIPLLVRMAVPMFFMMSGALFLNPDRKVTNDSICRHLKKILINLCFFGYLMAVIELIVTSKSFELRFMYIAIVNILQEKTWSHLWYLYATIGLYLLTPILRPWISQISKREIRGSIIVVVVLFAVIPTVNDILSLQITQFGLTTPRGALLWYLLGYYFLSIQEDIKTYKKSLVYLILFIGGGLTAAFGIVGFQMKITLIQPYHIWIVLYSSALYIILLRNRLIEQIAKSRVIKVLSSCSLVVYIIHPVFLNFLYKGIHLYPDRFPPVLGELFISVIVSAASVIGALVIRRIPLLKKYV